MIAPNLSQDKFPRLSVDLINQQFLFVSLYFSMVQK
jgi:hypothetical protein